MKDLNALDGKERRNRIVELLSTSRMPLSGTELSKILGVSRQVIVQDIALLRMAGNDILSFARGYRMTENSAHRRVLKVRHTEDDVEKELNLIVDMGGTVVDVFIYHRSYGTVRANMNIKSRLDIKNFLSDIKSGKSSLLSNATSGYHYHTVEAESDEMLDAITAELDKAGFIAPLQEYEPPEVYK